MPIRIKPPTLQDFILEKTDKEFENVGSPTTVRVRQATQGDEESRESLFNLTQTKFTNSGERIQSNTLGMNDVWRREVFLTLSDCNIELEEGVRLFEFKNGKLVDENKFHDAWMKLDPIVADEIIEKVHELNTQWGPEGNK